MAETEAVSMRVSIGIRPKCNGTNHHSQPNDLDNSYVFVSGADAVDSKAVVAESSNATVLSGKISDDEVNGNAESIDGYTVEGLTGKTQSSGEAKVDQVEEDSEVALDGEQEDFDDEIGTLEACQGSQDMVVGVVECESEHVSVWPALEDDVNLVGQVVETNGTSPLTASLESNPIISKQDADEVQDVVDVVVKPKDEVNLSVKVVENGEHEDSLSNSLHLDLESKTINSKEETNMVEDVKDEVKLLMEEVTWSGQHEVPPSTSLDVDLETGVVECKSQDVNVKAEQEVKLYGEVVENAEIEVPKPISLDSDMESCTINDKEETNSLDLDMESHSINAVAETADLEIPPSTSCDVDLESNPIYNKEEIYATEDVVECEFQVVSAKADDEVKSLGEVSKTAEHEVPPSASLDLGLDCNPTNTKEVVDVVEHELQDVSVEANDDVNLSREVVETSEHEIPPSTSLDVDLESKSINSQEEKEVVKDVVERGLQDVCMKVHAEDEVKLAREVVETGEWEIPSSTSLDLDLESITINRKEGIYVAENAVEHELQDVCVKAEDEVNLSAEVVETSEHEIPPSTSLDVDLESKSINSQEEKEVVKDVVERGLQDVCMKVHAEDEVKLAREVVETGEWEIPSSTSLDLDLESITKNRKEGIYVAENAVEHELQDVSAKAEDEVHLSAEVVETSEHEIPPSTSLDMDLLTKNTINTREETDVVEGVAECEFKNVSVKAEYEKSLGEVVEDTSPDLDMESRLIDTQEDTNVAMDVIECESQDSSVKSKDEVKLLEEVIKTGEHEVTLSKSLDLESKPINTEKKINVVANAVEGESQDATLKAKDEVNLSGEVVEIAEHELPSSTSTKEDMGVVAKVVECDLQDVSVKTEDEVKLSGEVEIEEQEAPSSTSDSSYVSKEGAANIELETEVVEDTLGQIDGAPGSIIENFPLGENVDTGNSQDINTTHVAPPKGSSVNMSDREEASIKSKRKPFNFLIKFPRFDDESLREQTRLAKLNIDEKTKLRDAIQAQIQEKRTTTQIHGIDYEYAKCESQNARKLMRSKRIEIDSLHYVINKAKNALSIDDIDNQIYNVEHMIQHETLPLKEEKQLIREIKQLRQLREQLSSNMGSQDEIEQALEQRGEAEVRLKILRKELDVLKRKVLKAEAAAVEAETKYDDEIKKVKEIEVQFRAAADVRQTAYVQWQSLRKELSKKNGYFFKYKNDASVARNYVYSNDTDSVHRLCMNNVERFMVQWNTNDEFRRDYAKFNARSTMWRLGTLDGRALGPDELPPVLPGYAEARVNRVAPTPVQVDLAAQFPTLELKQERIAEIVAADGKSMKKVNAQRVTNKEPALSAQVNGLDTVSSEDITLEEPKKSREEIEAEEMERKEAESKLKEQRRLEALAKANEARERKKKQAEKLQMRAELKTLKEAEQKEKEREKRLRKKERKKAASSDVSDSNTCEIGRKFETTTKEVEVKDTSSSVGPNKKPKNHWLFGKQAKTKSSVPAALRNRNKKKLQQWMWVGITSVVIFITFWLGNIGVFSNFTFQRRSPVMI